MQWEESKQIRNQLSELPSVPSITYNQHHKLAPQLPHSSLLKKILELLLLKNSKHLIFPMILTLLPFYKKCKALSDHQHLQLFITSALMCGSFLQSGDQNVQVAVCKISGGQ